MQLKIISSASVCLYTVLMWSLPCCRSAFTVRLVFLSHLDALISSNWDHMWTVTFWPAGCNSIFCWLKTELAHTWCEGERGEKGNRDAASTSVRKGSTGFLSSSAFLGKRGAEETQSHIFVAATFHYGCVRADGVAAETAAAPLSH